MKRYLYILSFFFVLLLAFTEKGMAQTCVTNPGASWTVPAGVTTATVYCWGGGGGGGGSTTGAQFANGGGGGGGACAISVLTIVGGQVYTITQGAGGSAGSTAGGAGGAGGNTTFTGAGGTVIANGGSGGAGSIGSGGAHAGGTGASTGTGTTIYSGGSGSAGNDGTSSTTGITGTGGGGAGSGGNGTTPASSCAATGPGGIGTYSGGTGGDNPNCNTTTNLAGVAGNAPGGGGSGANCWTSSFTGGAGGAGQVIICYNSTTIIESNGVFNIGACPFTGTFYDSGGSGGNYNNNESFTQTITAPGGSCLSVAFTSFTTESSFDYLYVYDGPSTASSLIGIYNSTTSPGTVLSSAGSLTFKFTSDGSVFFAGWAATVTCIACTPDACVNATALTSGVLLAGQTNAASTWSSSDPTPSCYWDGFGNTTWYTLTTVASSSITVLITDGAMTYPAVSIYSGACGSLSEVGCKDANTSSYNPSLTTGCLPAGTYHIMVWDDLGTGGTYGITATAVGCIIANNPCASAYAIPNSNLSGAWNTGFTSVGATADGSQAPAPFNYDCNTANDWFSFVAQGPNIEISVSSGVACMDPEINLYSSNPCVGGLEPIGIATSQHCDAWGYTTSSISLFNNDPAQAAPFYFPLTTGQTYWFSVNFNMAGGCTGTYSVHVNNPANPDPAGTDCKTAQILCAGGTYSGAANLWGVQELSYVYPNTANPTCCNLNEEINSSWYVLNILTGGTLTFTLQAIDGTDDYDFALYKGATCTLGQPVSCNYSSYPGITGIDGANCTGGSTGFPCSKGVSTCANDGAPGFDATTATSANSCDGCSNFTNAQIGDAASTWNSTLNVLTNDVYIFYVNGYTPSSGSYQFTFGGTAVLGCALPIILPVELLNFTAALNGKEVDLKWSTASEVNNDYFTIEKSTDGRNFEEMIHVKGAKNSTEKLNYSTIDYTPYPGISYYRISQTDFNGAKKELTIVAVNNKDNDGMFTIVPNPTNSILNINYACDAATVGTLNVYDCNGILVLTKDITCASGRNSTQLDLGEKPIGIYLVTFSTNDKFYRTKLIKN